ncbi:MAG: AAA family ATPase [Nitrospirota bacterium]
MGYETYWGLAHPPFEEAPDPDRYVPVPGHEAAFQSIREGIDHRKGLVVLTGEAGSGKTLLARRLVRTLDPARHEVGLIVNPYLLTRDTWLREVLSQFGVRPVGDLHDQWLRLMAFLVAQESRRKRVVLLVDEAQALGHVLDGFDALRMCRNVHAGAQWGLTLVLIGRPELSQHVQELGLACRVGQWATLSALSPDDAKRYVEERLGMAGQGARPIIVPDALDAIVDAAAGIPLRLNMVADRALLRAYQERRPCVDASLVASGVAETWPGMLTESIEPIFRAHKKRGVGGV